MEPDDAVDSVMADIVVVDIVVKVAALPSHYRRTSALVRTAPPVIRMMRYPLVRTATVVKRTVEAVKRTVEAAVVPPMRAQAAAVDHTGISSLEFGGFCHPSTA